MSSNSPTIERRLIALRNHCSPNKDIIHTITHSEDTQSGHDIAFNLNTKNIIPMINLNHTAGTTFSNSSSGSSSECSSCCSSSQNTSSCSTSTSSPKGSSSPYQPRPIEPSDYDKGYLALLSQLTTVGDISRESFQKRLSQLDPNTYRIVVIEDPNSHRIVAAATVFVEKKFVHECGSVGHIEDVVVDSNVRGQHLGVKVIEACKQFAQQQGCYKTILDCSEKNVKFYEKCGFVRKEIQMRFDHEHERSK
ncbi:hypothetical protein C9374_007456 [Naegleria lovaniensis]|uniref:Glucosamine 6-phosphate N-acetyltransferase n=1 Tax=Naegleria lovaniensis TaxID=51637 RepID=A0AA88KGM0_NAELO|nr:uncharacterized protein C9374_007456 [Naegleria lovaniensis]KAG2379317.1 hypothetical protein C9374_007456 [Naegleria lovaniensis]